MKSNSILKDKYLILFLAIALQSILQVCYAQEELVEEAKAKYPDARAVILNNKEEYNIFIEDGKLKGTCEVNRQIYINKESAISLQNESVSTNSFMEAKDINAYTLVPKNKKYEKRKVEKIELKDDLSDIAFYDEQKSYKFVFPSVQVGAITSLTHQIIYNDPHFMGSFYWTDFIPSIQKELKITVQKNININYKIFNQDKLNIEFTKEEKKNEIIYTWKTKNTDAVQRYDDAPDFRYYEPYLIFYISNYEIDKKPQQLLGTTKNLYNWYYDLLKNINKKEETALKNIVDSLVAGTTDEMQKVKKIFYWVQDNVSYVAFEDGLGGLVPRDASAVCSKKYGDCKDMANIINEMLKLAGIKSYLTWIGSRDIPTGYSENPTPMVDNHMITSYLDKQNKWHFLDGTGKKADIDLYTSFIQGKEALIGISKDSFMLVKVPVKDTSINQTLDTVIMDVKDKLLVGKGNATLTGYDALNYYYRTQSMTKEEKEDFFKRYFTKGNNKVQITNSVLANSDRAPIYATYNFNLPDYIRYNQNELYVNLNLDNDIGLETINGDRKIPLEFRHKTKKTNVVILNIPEGYKIDYIPENVQNGNEIIGYNNHYEVKDNKIILSAGFYINTLLLQPKDFEKYNKILTEQVKANKQVVSFIKK